VSLVIPTTTRHFPEKRGEETALLMAIFETPPPAPTPREPGDDPSENPAKKPTYHKPKKEDVNEVVIGGKLYKLSASMCFPCLTSLWIDSKGMSGTFSPFYYFYLSLRNNSEEHRRVPRSTTGGIAHSQILPKAATTELKSLHSAQSGNCR